MIGPDIPKQLKKRRDQEPEEHHSPEQSSVSEETKPITGPEIPTDLLNRSTNSSTFVEPITYPVVEEEEEDPDAYVPALPPDLLESRQKRASKPEESRRRAPVGPAMMPPSNPNAYRREEDNIIGPSIPVDLGKEDEGVDSTIAEIEERFQKQKRAREGTAGNPVKKLEREEWMLVPPEHKYLDGINLLASRQFSKKSIDPSINDSSVWTETPADRERRLREGGTSSPSKKARIEQQDEAATKTRERDELIHQQVQKHNETNRAKSLISTHKSEYLKSRSWEKNDDTRQPFDRERDMGGSRRLDAKKKNDIIDKAKDLGGRFSHSKKGMYG